MHNIEKLYDQVFTESTITCGKCGHQDELMADAADAASTWDHCGWVVVRDKVYCPDCDEKRLEAQEKKKAGKAKMKKSPAKKRKPTHR